MFNPVAPYRYLLPNLYFYVADIANPGLFVCSSRIWIRLDNGRFYNQQIRMAGLPKTVIWGLPDRCDISTACRLCRLDPATPARPHRPSNCHHQPATPPLSPAPPSKQTSDDNTFNVLQSYNPTGQVGLGVGSWPSNRATEGSNPKGTRLYFVILLKNVEKIFDWH